MLQAYKFKRHEQIIDIATYEDGRQAIIYIDNIEEEKKIREIIKEKHQKAKIEDVVYFYNDEFVSNGKTTTKEFIEQCIKDKVIDEKLVILRISE